MLMGLEEIALERIVVVWMRVVITRRTMGMKHSFEHHRFLEDTSTLSATDKVPCCEALMGDKQYLKEKEG